MIHGIWDGPVEQAKAATLLECELTPFWIDWFTSLPWRVAGPDGGLVRLPGTVSGGARAAIRVRVAAHERALLSGVSFDPDIQAVWYRLAPRPAAGLGPGRSPPSRR